MNPNNNKGNFTQAEQDLINGGKTDLKRPKSPHQQTGNGNQSTYEAADASEALALTKHTVAASTSALQKQAMGFAEKIQTSDMALADQLADFLIDRPQRFKVMLANAIATKLHQAETEAEFIDLDIAEPVTVKLPQAHHTAAVAALTSGVGCVTL